MRWRRRRAVGAASPVAARAARPHQDAYLYPDPDVFDPDRWLERRSAQPQDSFTLTEAALALATVTARWRLEHLSTRLVRPAISAVASPGGVQQHPDALADQADRHRVAVGADRDLFSELLVGAPLGCLQHVDRVGAMTGSRRRRPKIDEDRDVEDVTLLILEWPGEQGVSAMIRMNAERLANNAPAWTFAASGGPLEHGMRADGTTFQQCMSVALARLRDAGLPVPR